MESWVTWVIQSVTMLGIGVIGFFLKQTLASVRADNEKTNKRVDAIEEKLNATIQGLPFNYTLRDDFLRSMSRLENKMDEVRDVLLSMKNNH